MFIRKILFALIFTATIFVPQTFIFAQDSCPEGQYWSENQQGCVTDPSYHACPDNEYWDPTVGECVPLGNTNQTGGNTNQTGGNTNQTGGNTNQTCPDGFTWDAIIGQCIIAGGVINGNDDSGSGNGGSGTGGTGGNTGGTSGACLTSFTVGQTPRNFCELMSLFLKLLNSIIPLLVALAIVFFIWGVIQYVINPASSEEREKGQQYMIWGIVGIFCIVSIWGLVALLTGTFGISTVVIPQLQQQ